MQAKLLKRIPLNRLMDLKIDYAFKQLFGNEKNKDITVVFLNAILQRTGREQIKDISFTNTEAGGEYVGDKQSRLDLLVVTHANEWINVEIQFSNKYDMIKRSIYYWSGTYRSQLREKMGYKELNSVIAINILNYNLFKRTDRFHTTYHLYEDEEKFKLTNVMEFHFIEMAKLIKDWKANKLNPWDDVLARWLLMLGMVDRRKVTVYDDIYKELEEIAMKDEKLRTAFRNWEKLSMTQEEMLAYEARLKHVLDEEAFLREAELREEEAIQSGKELGKKLGMEEGMEEGRKKGMEAGRIAGRKAGREEGKKEGEKIGERRANEAIARRLLAQGMDVETIAEVTGLEKECIMEIKD